ncbi:hypothetical protein WOLCODRAFT_148596, partial [Wolfiporia cocos MD-104 SS10]
ESEQERALWEGTATARDDPERGTRRGGRKDAGEGPAGWRTVPAGLRAVRAARRASRAPAGLPAGDGAGVGSVRAWASLDWAERAWAQATGGQERRRDLEIQIDYRAAK